MKYQEDLHLEATELRLGLPGCRSANNEPDHKQSSSSSSSSSSSLCASRGTKRTSSDLDASDSNSSQSQQHTCPSPPKAQIVGWPPIRSCRKNSIQVIKNGIENSTPTDGSGVYVKVSMDGAPYLRKIDLNIYKGYTDLLMALGGMFKCNIINMDGSNHQYATTYQDKDGDWMLAGDVPWEMFVSSCKRLRIMRASEPKGLII